MKPRAKFDKQKPIVCKTCDLPYPHEDFYTIRRRVKTKHKHYWRWYTIKHCRWCYQLYQADMQRNYRSVRALRKRIDAPDIVGADSMTK